MTEPLKELLEALQHKATETGEEVSHTTYGYTPHRIYFHLEGETVHLGLWHRVNGFRQKAIPLDMFLSDDWRMAVIELAEEERDQELEECASDDASQLYRLVEKNPATARAILDGLEVRIGRN